MPSRPAAGDRPAAPQISSARPAARRRGRRPGHSRGAARWRVPQLLIVVVLTLVGLTVPVGPAGAGPVAPRGTTFPALGTLGTSPSRAAGEAGAGVRTAMMEISWRQWEPRPGQFDAGYERQMRSRLTQLRATGLRVTLGLGLHFTPDWVKAMPDARLVDQNGRVSAGADFVFSAAVRERAWSYLQRVGSVLDLSQVDAVRVTSGVRSELLYPEGGSYWAFDANARTGRGLPDGVARNPYPDWRPGGGGLGVDQMQQWALWYVDSLAEAGAFQMRALRKLGFPGTFEILTPGVGVYANKLDNLAEQNLPNGALGVGAYWSRIYPRLLQTDRRIVANISSLADGSGGDDSCSAADRSVPLTSAATNWWGGARWISRVADEYGIDKVGENPGYSSATRADYVDGSSSGAMATAMRQGATCGLRTVYWAHDDQFWDGTVPFSRWAAYAG